MLTKFWEVVGEKLAERWLAIVGPAAVFWGVALGLWLADDADHLQRLRKLFAGEPTGVQALRLAGFLAVVVASSFVVRSLALPVLRLLSGYWPDWPGVRGLSRRLVERRWQMLVAEHAEWQGLWNDESDWSQPRPYEANDAEPWVARAKRSARSAELDTVRRLAPGAFADVRPTRIGNVLAAAETRPTDKYGLDAVLCWPALWLVLPDDARTAMTEARRALDAAVAAIIWGVLGFGLAVVHPLAAPVALAVVLVGYGATRRAAEGFGSLLEAVYDVHRNKLYAALRIEPAADSESEPALGRRVSSHLLRGGSFVNFLPVTPPKNDGT